MFKRRRRPARRLTVPRRVKIQFFPGKNDVLQYVRHFGNTSTEITTYSNQKLNPELDQEGFATKSPRSSTVEKKSNGSLASEVFKWQGGSQGVARG